MSSKAFYMGFNQSSQISTEHHLDLSFLSEQSHYVTMEMVANSSWFPQIIQYKNTISGNLSPLNFLFYPSARMKKIREEKARNRRKWLTQSHSPWFPSLPSQGHLGHNHHSKIWGGFSPLFCGPLLYRHQSSDISSQRGGHAISPTTTTG